MQVNTIMTNPSFNFTWDQPKTVQGKVFARKRSQKRFSRDSANDNSNSNLNKSSDSDSGAKKQSQTTFPPESRKNVSNHDTAADDTEEHFRVNKPLNKNRHYPLFDHEDMNKNLYVNVRDGKSMSEKLFSSNKSFKHISNIHNHIVANLEKNEFLKLTTVQEKAIPTIISGENTLIRSQTGSGKTLAYAVPILNALLNMTPKLKRQDGVQALIVVPTRELALQTHEIFSKINTFQWIVVGHLCGGENRKTEKDRLRKGVHVLIGTPGRLLDHILHTAAFKTNNVKYLILDEADRLLDMGFRKDIVRLVEEIDNAKVNLAYDPMALLKTGINEKNNNDGDDEKDKSLESETNTKQRQTILLSATLSKGVSELAEFAMKDHIYIDALDSVNPVQTSSFVIPDTVQHQFIITPVKHRLFTLSALLISLSKKDSKVFVFMASSQMVEYHYRLFKEYLIKMPRNRKKLLSSNIVILNQNVEEDEEDSDDEEIVVDMPIFKLHGSMDQQQRKAVFQEFRASKKGALLCTDVASRGIDVPTADCIIQYTGPQTDEDYLHRVGRTGRAGKAGLAIIFLTHEEQEYVSRLQDYKVFLKKLETHDLLKHLCEVMEEENEECAASALQRRYEMAVAKDGSLHKAACFAYSSWARFYNSYTATLRPIFNFKRVNLGHYVSSFAIRDPPSVVAKVVRGQVKSIEKPNLNRKLANHSNEDPPKPRKQKRKAISLTTSEYASGLEPSKKKKKKKKANDNQPEDEHLL